MKFGDNLKQLRKSKKLSQEDLAEKVNVSRQSVSKWETGEAYPEMNNILQLCKIFNCEINSLVNDNMVDLDSLDEEIKMSVVKFKEDKQKKMKGLSKAIYVLARIGKVFTIIGIVGLAIAMLVIPIVASNVKVKDNNIIQVFDEKIRYERNDKEVTIFIDDNDSDFQENKITDKDEVKALNLVIDYIEDNDITKVSLFIEAAFVFLEITLFVSFFTLKHLDKLFTNIHSGDTPFTMENVEHIKKMAYLMIALIIFPAIASGIAGFVIDEDMAMNFDLSNLLYILILFSLSYIFEYGYYIQQDSNGKIYGEEDE